MVARTRTVRSGSRRHPPAAPVTKTQQTSMRNPAITDRQHIDVQLHTVIIIMAIECVTRATATLASCGQDAEIVKHTIYMTACDNTICNTGTGT